MADPDPSIKAFELLSDRVSNLEDSVDILLEQARLHELQTHGPLNSPALGLKGSITRHSQTARCRGARTQTASMHLDALIITYEDLFFQYISDKHFPSADELTFARFTEGEKARIAELYVGDGPYVSTRSAQIDSNHVDVCGESLQRLLDELVKDLPILGKCDNVHLLIPDAAMSIMVVGIPENVTLDRVLRELVDLSLPLTGRKSREVDVYDIDVQKAWEVLYIKKRRFTLGQVAFMEEAHKHEARNSWIDQHPYLKGLVRGLCAPDECV